MLCVSICSKADKTDRQTEREEGSVRERVCVHAVQNPGIRRSDVSSL